MNHNTIEIYFLLGISHTYPILMVISSLMFYIEGCGLMTVLIIWYKHRDEVRMQMGFGYEYQYNCYYCCYYIIAIVFTSTLIISNFMVIQRDTITKLFKEVCKQNWGINLTSKTKRKITGILLHLDNLFDISLFCMNRYIPSFSLKILNSRYECNYM